MRVSYKIVLYVDTDDHIKTLSEIEDAIQDSLSGDPEIFSIRIIKHTR